MRLHLGGRLMRGGALVLGTALALCSGVTVLAPAASAASVGTLTFGPATGTDTTGILATTVSAGNTGCPAGTTNVRALVNGPGGWTNITVIGNTTSGVSTTSDFSVPFSDTFQGIAQSNGLTITAGRYDVSMICQNRLGTTQFGTFDAPIFFTSATHYQSTDPNAVTTTTVVSALPASPQVSGTSVTFTATLTPSNAAGTVQFKDGANNLGSPQTVSSGKATLTTSSLSVGSHSIIGVFTPTNSNAFTSSTSSAITYVINPAATATSTVVSALPASPQVSGTSVTFTATLTPSNAAGTVQFKDGANNLGTAQAVSAGKATLTTSSLSVGSHSITGVFTPTDSTAFAGSTSSPLTYVINPPATSTSTVVSALPASPQVSGTSVTFTATLTPSNAVGSVQFKDGSNNLGSAQPVSGGQAALTTSSLSVGSHQISAAFTPTDSAAFTPSTASAITYVINPPATSTAVTALPASPQVSGTSVTFTATLTPSNAAGTVQFKDGANNLGTAQAVSAGKATLTTSSLSVGSHSITGVFTPTDSTAFAGSTSPAITYVINPAPTSTSTAVTALPASPQVSGTSVTFTATLTPSNAAGTVQFKDGANNLGTAQAVSAGKATLTTSTLPVGSHSISAVFTPTDSTVFTGSTAPAITYVISAPAATPTSTGLSANPGSPQLSGTSVTFTASVTPTNAPGSVQFKDGSNNLGSAQPVSGGQAALTTSSLSVGSHSITALFVPTDSTAFTGSTSPAIVFVVNAPPTSTSTAVTALPASPQVSGTSVTFTATLTPSNAAGTVQFKDGANNLGTAQAVSAGKATLTTSSLSVGSHSITGVFTPTDSTAFTGSTSPAITFVVNAPPTSTSTAVTALPASPQVSGISVTFTATLTPSNAVGSVQFKDGANNLGTAQAVSAGKATLTTSSLSVGSHSISAVFTPTDSTAFTGSTAPAITYVISAPAAQNTSTSLGASPASPAMFGVPVTFTATVTPAAAGTVQFKDGANNLGTPQTVSGGQASLTTSTLSVGSHSITGVFSPTDPTAFNGSSSAALPFTITQAPAQATSTAVSPSPASPATAGTSVTFTATVSPAAPGTVQFKDGSNDLGSPATVSGGQASTSTSSLTVGSHSITAVFTPTDSNAFLGSTSPAITYVITAAATATSTGVSANPGSPQPAAAPVTFTATVTPSNAAGAVQFLDGTADLGTSQTVSGGQASTSTSTLAAGTHSITAVFTPTDANAFTGSTSSAISYVVLQPTSSNLGTLTFDPATGQDTSPILFITHSTGSPKGCPAGATNVRAIVNGPTGWSNIPVVGNTTSGVSNTADFTVPISDTFSGIAQSNGLNVTAGRYDITLICQNRLGTQSFGTFTGSLFFTDATHYQSTDPSNTVTTTTTSLTATPDARQDLGKPITLIGTVTPNTAVGAIQFKDTVAGVTTNLGAPVPVTSAAPNVRLAAARTGPLVVTPGTAKLVISNLPFGLHTFSAAFIATDAKKFSTSTSDNVVYVVALPAPPKLITPAHLLGSGHFGTSLVCSATFQGATSVVYSWFRNGKQVPGAAGSSYLIANADRFHVIACRATGRNAGGSTPSTSRGEFVGLATFRLLKAPEIFGKHQVGQTLIACPGRWTPAPGVFVYQWERDGHAIAGATKQLYKVTRTDMGHRISVRVMAYQWFFYPAVAVSPSI